MKGGSLVDTFCLDCCMDLGLPGQRQHLLSCDHIQCEKCFGASKRRVDCGWLCGPSRDKVILLDFGYEHVINAESSTGGSPSETLSTLK